MITTNLLARKIKRKSFEFREIDSKFAIASRIHKKPEWKAVVYPDGFDDKTQKGIKPYYDSENDVVTFQVVNMSQAEIDDKIETDDENQARIKIDRYRYRGGELIEKTRTKMWRRVHLYSQGANGLTNQQVAKLERWFLVTYQNLLVGNFRQARNEINGVIEQRDDVTGDSSLLETAGMLDTAQWLQTQITDYFDNHYDL